MHFGTKNTLKSNRNHTPKQTCLIYLYPCMAYTMKYIVLKNYIDIMINYLIKINLKQLNRWCRLSMNTKSHLIMEYI